MIKRKRKLNKQALVNVRRYTVVGNTERTHYFNLGDVVSRTYHYADSEYSFRYIRNGLEQWVMPCDII